jgi:hypothetical protein
MKTNFFSLAASLLLLTALQAQEPFSEGPFNQLIIRGATLIDGNGAPPRVRWILLLRKTALYRYPWWDTRGWP